jgi:hypothetical protein
MCKVWTQQDYREGNDTREVIEYVNTAGETAITVVDDDGDYTNVYNASGEAYDVFWYHSLSSDEQKAEAAKSMAKKGFTLKAIPQEVVAVATTAIQPVVEPTNTTQPLPGVVVQGRTLAQWTEEGHLNNGRKEMEHVHPTYPDGRVATAEEMAAFVASLTSEEADGVILLGLLGKMGAPTS